MNVTFQIQHGNQNITYSHKRINLEPMMVITL